MQKQSLEWKALGVGLVSGLWSAASSLSRALSQIKSFQPVALNARVISVGNIQAGGAGKTPLVALIAREAQIRGLRTCILTRGYRSVWESQGGVVCPGESQVKSQDCGDEAALLADLCPQAYLGVGADRVTQFKKVLERAGAVDLVILDDGFQHHKIRKDLEVVALTDAHFWNVPFREFPRVLRNADLIVWTKGEGRPDSYGKPFVRVKYRLTPPCHQERLWFVSGIADGNSASVLATQSGYSIVRHLSFKDHYAYRLDELQQIMAQASREGCRVALTGKDWVKWRDLGISRDAVVVLEPELFFEEGRETWSRILWGV